MAGQNHKYNGSEANRRLFSGAGDFIVHRRIQSMILSPHDSVIPCCPDKSNPNRSQPTSALRCQEPELHRQTQYMILSPHDSVIPRRNDPYAD